MARLAVIQRAWVRNVLIGVLLAAALLMALAWAMTGVLGRAALGFAVNGRDIGGYGVVEIEGVKGNVLSAFSIDAVRVRDGEGVWLNVEEVDIAWRVASVLGESIRIDVIEIGSVDLARRPVRSASGGGAGRAPAIRVDRLTIDQIRLAQGVAGPAADYAVHGRLARFADGALSVTANASRIDRIGDAAALDLERSSDGVLSGDVFVTAPAGGPLAALLRLGDVGWALEGRLGGTLQAGAGDYRLTVGETSASVGTLEWERGAWTLQASLRPDLWPALPRAAADLTAEAELTGQGRLSPFTIGAIDLRTQALSLQAFDLHSEDWRAELALTASGTALAQAYGVELQRAQARIERAGGQDSPAYDVALEMAGLSHDQTSADALFARLRIDETDQGYRIQTLGRADGLSAAEPRLQALLGETAQFDAMLALSGDRRALTLQRANASGAGWSAQADGVWRDAEGRLDATARLDLATIAPLELGITGPLSVNIATRDEGAGWDRLALQIQSDGLSGPERLTPLLGPLAADAQVNLGPDAITAPRIRARTNAVVLEAEARQAPGDPGWRARGDVVFDLSALQLSDLEGQAAGAFELDFAGERLSGRAQLQTEDIAAGRITLSQPLLRAEADMIGGAISGAWRFDAVDAAQTVSAQGRFNAQADQARLDLDAGQWGSIRATGAAWRVGETIEAQLAAADSRASQAWAAELRYRGALEAPYAGAAAGWLEAQRWPLANGDVTAARIDLDGPLSQLAFTAQAGGRLMEPFSLSAEGQARVEQAGVQLQTDLAGHWGERPIRATAPLSLQLAGDRLDAAAQLQLGEAEIALRASRAQSTRLVASVSAAPAQIVTELAGLPPALGRWGLDAQLERTGGVWSGTIVAQAGDIRPMTGAAEGVLDAEARWSLAETARFDLQAEAGGLIASAGLTRAGAITDLGVLFDPGWRGRMEVEGPLDTLARLYLPEGQAFTGEISGSADFQAGGVSGAVRIRDGAYSSQTAGVRLSPFSLAAEFAEDRLHIRQARLGDGEGGQANATGAIGFTDEGLTGAGAVRFDRFTAVSRPDLLIQATGQAQLSLQGRRLRIIGESDLDRLALTPAQSRGPNIPQIEVEELNRPETLDPPYRRPIRIELDYALRAEDSLFVSSRSFNSEWSADVRVQGPLNRLRLNGEANLRSGQATLLTRIFDMDEGLIRFAGPLNQTRMRLVGRHRRADLEVTARAEGPITQPRVSFESDPSLPEDEVLARLLFNQDSAALSPLQAAQLAAQLSGSNWLGALSDAGRLIGLDRLDIRQGDDGALAVLGGRRLGEDVYIELETGSAAALGAARIEWLITPDIVVLSRMTGDTDAQFAIRWRREFD